MGIAVVGLNPFAAPGVMWRKAAIGPHELAGEVARLGALPGVFEAVVLTGARRLEFYVSLEEGRDSFEVLAVFLAERVGVAPSECMPYLYLAEGLDATGHLFNVACGLDSFASDDQLVLEELREAAGLSRERRVLGPLLGRMFTRAADVAERAGAKVGAAGEAAEHAAVAFEIAERVFDDLPRREVLLIGGGKSCELTARRLVEEGAKKLMVINGSAGYAESIARSLGGEAFDPRYLEECLAKADVVLSATTSPALLLDARMVRRARKARRGRMMLVVDFADPARIEAACADVDDVYLYDRRDLSRISERTGTQEKLSGGAVADLAADETLAFSQWLEESELLA